MNYQKPKGTRDIFGTDARRSELVNARARDFFERGGYEEIKTPTFEFAELFTRSIGESTDIVEKEMYAFTVDRRVYVLRPEGTASVLRAVIENKVAVPAKFVYLGSMFRKEKPQKGRYREFSQIGVENLGRAEPFYDAEIIMLAQEFLKLLGAGNCRIEINSIGCPECRDPYRAELAGFLAGRRDRICEDCRRRLEKNILRVFDCKEEGCRRAYADAPLITDHLCASCGAHYEKVKQFLGSFAIATEENKRLVRGLDYYTRTVFEFKHPGLGSQDTIIAGGRYDRLMKELGGADIPCIGWALGVERLLLALGGELPEPAKRKGIFIAVMGEGYAGDLAQLYRRVAGRDFRCQLGNPRASIKSQMKDANRAGVDFVIIYGDDEAKEGCYAIKNMQSGEQVRLPKPELDNFLGSILLNNQ